MSEENVYSDQCCVGYGKKGALKEKKDIDPTAEKVRAAKVAGHLVKNMDSAPLGFHILQKLMKVRDGWDTPMHMRKKGKWRELDVRVRAYRDMAVEHLIQRNENINRKMRWEGVGDFVCSSLNTWLDRVKRYQDPQGILYYWALIEWVVYLKESIFLASAYSYASLVESWDDLCHNEHCSNKMCSGVNGELTSTDDLVVFLNAPFVCTKMVWVQTAQMLRNEQLLDGWGMCGYAGMVLAHTFHWFVKCADVMVGYASASGQQLRVLDRMWV